MTGYEVKIADSSMELTAKQRISVKDFSRAIALDDATKEGNIVTLNPVDWVVLDVHNEKSQDGKDYTKYLIIDKNGDTYVTGSEPLWTSFMGIWEEMKGETEEWGIEVFSLPSKNYKGKSFLSCSII